MVVACHNSSLTIGKQVIGFERKVQYHLYQITHVELILTPSAVSSDSSKYSMLFIDYLVSFQEFRNN